MDKNEYDEIIKKDMMDYDRTTNDGGYGGFALTPNYIEPDEVNMRENETSLYRTVHGSYGNLTSERKKSYMDNSQEVKVKDKCKIGGEGNTSAACNQGDIDNLELSNIDEDLEYYHADNATKDKYKLGVEENENNDEYTGCIMLLIDAPKWKKITDKIKEDDVYDEPGYGIEDEPHITIKYGLHDNVSFKNVFNIIKNKLNGGDIDLFLTAIDCFENNDFDVVKFNVVSDKLKDLNFEICNNFECQDEFDKYNPHMTIAYVNKGCGKKYKKRFNRPIKLRGSKLKYFNENNQIKETYDVLNNYKDTPSNNYNPDNEFFFGDNVNNTFSFNNKVRSMNYKKKYKDLPNNIYDYGVSENTNIINESDNIIQLNELPFIDDIKKEGGKIYAVGGIVRDELLGKDSKDLDIIITGVPINKIEDIVSKYGKVNSVGKSFGILKFRPTGYEGEEDIDISIPRTETPTGEGGHKGFDVKSDHNLSIEDDLYRRDLTINALAKDLDGNIIDPFGGLEDIKNKRISMVNPDAFSDDPLRMIRAIQFASRFDFDIDNKTIEAIQKNASRIKEIPSERILIEFEKIIKRGNPFTAAILLKQSGLLKNIFGESGPLLVTKKWDNVKNMGEFIWMLSHNLVDSPSEFFKNKLGGDIENTKIIKGLEYAYNNYTNNDVENRVVLFNVNKISPQAFNSNILPDDLKKYVKEFKNNKYPLTNKDLTVNGNDLKNMGLNGENIGKMLRKILLYIYADKLENNKEKIIKFVQTKINNYE